MRVRTLIPAIFLVFGVAHAAPIDGTFNYQGRLTDGGVPVTGNVNFTFSLHDAEVGGSLISTTIIGTLPVNDGLFNIDLNFGASVFDGNRRWLEIQAKRPSDGAFVNLGRQEICGTPYAIQTRGIYVDNALDVGIGTTTPLADLHIGGSQPSLLVKDDASNGYVLTRGPTTDGWMSVFETGSKLNGLPAFSLLQNLDRARAVFENTDTGVAGLTAGISLSTGSGHVLIRGSEDVDTITLWGDADANSTNGTDQGWLNLRSTGGGPGGEISVRNDDGNETIELLGGVTNQEGRLYMYREGSSNTMLALKGDVSDYGAQIATWSEDGFLQTVIEPDYQGQGAYMSLRRTNSSTGLVFDGNNGADQCVFSVAGADKSFIFDASHAGSASVQLPNNAVQDTEMLDEPGVASKVGSGFVELTGVGTHTILSRSITAPTSGFCVVIGTCEASVGHTNGTSSIFEFGVSDVAGSLPSSQRVALVYGWNTPSSVFQQPVTAHGTFPVTAGTHTFYLLAWKEEGACTVRDMHMTVMFFPTAYGTVDPVLMSLPGQTDEQPPRSAPLTAADIRAEQLEAVAFDQSRRAAEDADYARRFAELEARIRELEAQQGLLRTHTGDASPEPDTSGAFRPYEAP